ncbi:hypothetical protein EVAR_79339_1 [Eumeta japonica]|uniref:Uncharacterized protein n=1 Tax=Eumeta variegata TaxID=151549 RepID=A0A4C1TFX5_EUMVA|nr:hypothetical protein EVAR_79339_1 [Eumeta japonica]
MRRAKLCPPALLSVLASYAEISQRVEKTRSGLLLFAFTTPLNYSEDDVPLSRYVKDNDDRSKLDSDLSAPGTSGYSHHQSSYSSDDYVLVKYLTKKTEYHYAAVCSSVDDEDGEVRVTFLKIG